MGSGRSQGHPPTMKQVAAHAGVSATTVSFVINGAEDHAIPQETQERVWQAVRELGYRPNAMAKALRTRRTNLIGFIADAVATTPFAVALIKGAQDCARANGKLLLIIDADGDVQQRGRALDTLLGRGIEGVLYAAMFHQEVALPEQFHELPTVLVDCYTPDNSFSSFVPDEVQGGKLATETLVGRGHRRIAIITNDVLSTGYPAPRGRLEGYKQALAEAGLPFDDDLFVEGDGDANSGYEATFKLRRLSEPPTAIFCCTDRMAMGVYDALKELGFRIPKDVAVIGFDNQEVIAAFLRPPLSSIALPHYEMGRQAVELLLSGSRNVTQQRVPCPLVERASA